MKCLKNKTKKLRRERRKVSHTTLVYFLLSRFLSFFFCFLAIGTTTTKPGCFALKQHNVLQDLRVCGPSIFFKFFFFCCFSQVCLNLCACLVSSSSSTSIKSHGDWAFIKLGSMKAVLSTLSFVNSCETHQTPSLGSGSLVVHLHFC